MDSGKSATNIYRIGHVDDHETVGIGLAAMLADQPDLDLVARASTVPDLLLITTELDVVLLDLRLRDGSTPQENVELLRDTGAAVLVFTSGEEVFLVRAAARAGVMGVVLKMDSPSTIVAAIRQAAHGQMVPSVQWAAAVDADPRLSDVGLSPREREVLELYASGVTADYVARHTSLSVQTVNDYVNRIRRKYAEAGRPIRSKTDLYVRAVEDGFLPTPEPRVARDSSVVRRLFGPK